jgi:hypothetical protein
VSGAFIIWAMQNNQQLPPQAQIMQIVWGKVLAKTIYVATKLSIADLLKGGARPISELARETKTHEPSLYRMLRTLASAGIFAETEPRHFKNTPLSSVLAEGPESVQPMVLFAGMPMHDRAWEELLHCVKTGKTGFEKAFGMPIFDYFPKHPEESEIFNNAMTSLATKMSAAVVEAYDFTGIRKLVDVGGGHGALMSGILGRYPSMTGVILDLPKVVEGTRKRLESAGFGSRCEAVGGDFFKSIPGGDAIISSHIIHDWDDARAEQILKNCHKALAPGAKLLLVETVVPEGNAPSAAKFLDMEMLVMPGGLERTEREYRELYERAGFRLTRIVPTKESNSVIEGVRV